MKYIIKNCNIGFENFENNFICTYTCRKEGITSYCKDVSDCILKQIVELCKKQREWERKRYITGEEVEEYNGAYFFAQEILNLLEIEEVNEE